MNVVSTCELFLLHQKTLSRELEHSMHHRYVIGVDEAGRGCLAGPVVAAACWLPEGFEDPEIRDSKKVTTEKKRERLYDRLVNTPGVVWATGVVEAPEIDQINILQATFKAMVAAVNQVQGNLTAEDKDCCACIDGNRAPAELTMETHTVVKGDSKCLNIAAASIIAKVTRDRIMNLHDQTYPEWNFVKHKGYPSATHRAYLQSHPCTVLHRKSFKPVKEALKRIH